MSRGHVRRLGPAAAATILGALWLAPTPTAAGTFAYRKAITFKGVVGGPHLSFPALISLVDPDLGARVSSPRGYDVIFRGEDPATCGGPPACTLDHEIERWDGPAGTLLAWVRVPSLSDGTVIFMYYGGSRITSSREAGPAVWDADYVGVWHLEEAHNAAVNGYRDSSRYRNHGHGGKGALAAAPNPVVGSIGAGQHFDDADGTYDFIDTGDDGTLHIVGDEITLQAWVRHDITIDAPHGTPPSVGNAYGILNHKGWNDGYRLALDGASVSCPGGSITEPCLNFSLPGSTHLLRTTQSASLGPNQWHHVVATYDGATMKVYVDGVNEGSLPKTGNVSPSTADQSMWIGHADQPGGQPWSAQYEGDLDEIRISRVARSPEWIATEYANQSSPAAFHRLDDETPGPYVIDTLTVNYRSIGTAGVLYSTGVASVALGGTTVSFGGGASLPPGVGRGDVLTFTGAPLETLYILSRDSATQVTLQTPATAAHLAQGYTVARAFNTLTGWESAREGDLVLEKRREVGVAYNDGPLAGGVTIDGSTTDPVHSLTLTVAPGQRHLGVAGTGTVIDNGAGAPPAIRILDDHVTIEWFEIKGGTPAPAHGIEFANGLNPANLGTVRYNIIHGFGSDGIRVGDPDSIVDIYGNVIYEAEYGIHLPVDLTPAARVNAFSNTIYGCNAATGPSGVKSDVRQTSVRVDLRNNIAHNNANGDFGVGSFFDYGFFCDLGCTQVANGGVLGPTEFLADRSNDTALDFTNVGTSCLYLGSAWPFRGVSVALGTPGVLSGADIQWDYWDGTAWTSLEAGPFADGTGNFQYTGHLYWPDDPPGWTPTSVSTSPALYYVRACLAAASYTTLPVEEQITRIDVSMASRNNLSSDITGRPHSVLWGGSTGVDLVSLGAMSFLNTTPGAEDLHIGVGSAAEDAAFDLGRRFSADIDGALRVDPWDIGADEASASTGPDIAITKDDGQATAVPGTPVLYTITVSNNGPGQLTSATVLDVVPAEIQGPVFTPSTGVYDPGTGVWTGLNLGPSASATLTLQGTITSWALGTLVNTVQVDPPGGVTDPDPSNNSASDVDTLTPEADLALVKDDNADPIDIGNVLVYRLTITNKGPSNATGVIVTDTLAPDLEFESVTPSQGVCNYDVPSRTLTCNLGTVAPGTATVALVVRPLALGTFGNTASVGGNEPDPIPGDNTASELTTVGESRSCVVTTDLEGGDDWGSGVAVQSDGRIVLGGYGYRPAPGGLDFAAVRYLPGLQLDNSFGVGGKTATEIDKEDQANAGMALQSDGKIVVGGHNRVGEPTGDDDFTLVRYESDGTLDATFNPAGTYGYLPYQPGIVTTEVDTVWDLGRALALQPDGKILLAGPVQVGGVAGSFDLGIARYLPDGDLDSSFGTGGTTTTPIGVDKDYANALAVQPDGKIVVAGATWNGTDWDWVIVRYDPDGSLDASFGGGGFVVADLQGTTDWTEGVAVQPDGRIVVIGQSHNGSDDDFAVARYNPDGSLDVTFNPAATFGDPPYQPGMVFVRIGAGDDLIGAGALQPDGKILAVGFSDNNLNDDFAMVRLNPDGSLDAGFGIGGKVRTAIGGDGDEARAVALQSDGRILVAGRSYNVSTANWDFALARYTSTGRLDAGCGTTRYRSIGTAADDAGFAAVTTGSNVVTGSGTSWQTSNRGRGDVITLSGAHYTVLSVDSETSLTLTEPYAGPTGAGVPYLIRRQFTTLQDWEACISDGGPCVFFPVASANLIADSRSEVGIAYKDSVFALTEKLEIDGSTTDALHRITLTVDPGNRHDGIPGAGVLVDGQDQPFGIDVEDDYVTLEWLEIIRFRGVNNEGAVSLSGGDGPTGVLLQNLLIHDFFDPAHDVSGIRLSGAGVQDITVRNTMIWDGDENGIQGDEAMDVVTIENTSIDGMVDGGRGIYAEKSTVRVFNTIVTGSTSADYVPGTGTITGSNNTSSDTTAPGPGFQHGVVAAAVFVTPGADLHLKAGPNPARDSGVDLFSGSGFRNDIEGQLRPVDAAWDRGADEFAPSTPDLALTKDDGQAAAVPGTPISYTITVTNNGPDPVAYVTVSDPLPPAILGGSFATLNGSYSSGTGLWTFASPLLAGQSAILTLNGVINPAATGSLTNTATVLPPAGFVDTVPGNDSDSDVDTLTPMTDLALTKTDDLDPIEIGNLLTYALTVTNTGPSDATGVILTDTLVPELDYESATPSQGLCNYDVPTRTLGCTLGALASGSSAAVSLVVRPLAVGTLGNTAAVSGNEPDPVSGNDSATEMTTVQTASNGVRFFTVTSTFEQNVLEWLNPPTAAYLSTEIVYRTDTFPTGPADPLATSIYNGGTAGTKDRLVHATGAGSNGQTFYYGAFVHLTPSPAVSAGRFCSGRPFDDSGPVKWAFSTGAFSITPPTVGGAGVVAPANDRALYAMERGPLGGEWPAGWEPVQLGGVVQSRSPVVPLTVNGANPVVYLGAQDGKVYVVNGTLGGAAAFPWAPTAIGGMVQAAPAGIFTAWGGAQNYLLVGTRDDGADNVFVALNPDTPGNMLGTFDNGGSPNGIGIITGMATVDYGTNRVYFTSYENPTGSNGTLWCLQMGPPGPVLSLLWQRALQDIDGSPIVEGGRVYVGSTDAGGTVYSINAATGSALDDRTFVHGDGPVKGFVWPDRSSSDLYFATDSFVWGISDTGAPNMPNKFASGYSLGGGVTPSTLLFVPGSHYVYVGGSDGRLYEIDVLGAAPTLKSQPLGDGLATVGAPSLDWFYSLIHVGTEAGIFYAVEVPLP